MSKLRQFLAERKAEIDRQIKALRDERSEIVMAERALPQTDAVAGVERQQRRAPDGGPTLKEMAVAVLADTPNGADANTIRIAISERFGREIARESMSPQLSRLGAAGILERNGRIWRVAGGNEEPTGQTNEASDGETSETSEAETVTINDLL